jgi:hypothetical protein
MVIEQGMTVAGKPLKHHLEAPDHFEAIRYARGLARQKTPLAEIDVRNLHLTANRFAHTRRSLLKKRNGMLAQAALI